MCLIIKKAWFDQLLPERKASTALYLHFPRLPQLFTKQECIPVGCVPPASVAIWGGGLPRRGMSAWGYTPPPAHCMLGYTPLPRWTESLPHTCETRIHSSRMRTACLLTVLQHALLGGGGTCPGVYLLGGVPARGGGTCPRLPPPP